tara:strand:+ start:2586 stop:3365 length:780 start_codon:yes stop_codon:yes gene_type:complete
MSHISYSEFRIWNECPYKHKLKYVDKVHDFQGSEYTAFGTAIHSVCENSVVSNSFDKTEHFREAFTSELAKLPETVKKNLNKELVDNMYKDGPELAERAVPALESYFGSFEVVSTEEGLYENMESFDDQIFKGYIDLVIKTEDGKHHILDWKTCSWGWDARKKSDKMTTYQLTLYKKYYAQKHNIDLSDIETYFGLLKRTAKDNKVEIFRVTSGNKKTENALKMLNNTVHNILRENHVKNKLACTKGFVCEFYKTEHCN